MRTLVIDTATAACSVALIEGGLGGGLGGELVTAAIHEVVGRGHAERLVPMIGELPGGGRADAVLVDCGPGSFTGVRVGLAAAIGLGIGWGVPVGGYTSTALIAATAFADHPDWSALVVALEGGHGELFVQSYRRPLAAHGALASLTPAAVLAALDGRPAVGNGARMLPDGIAAHALPDAARAVLLPATARTLPARPIYGRAPDAKPQAGNPKPSA